MSRPHGHARVNPSYPQAFGVCQRCGFWWNLVELSWQYEYSGNGLYNTRFLFCRPCLDTPQPQLKALRIKADPRPVLNARPEPFNVDDPNDFTNNSGVLTLISLSGYPTSAAGLLPGSVWSNALAVNVVGGGPVPDPAAPPMYYGGEIDAAQLLQYGGGSLPLTNPKVNTQLWNNTGVINISSG